MSLIKDGKFYKINVERRPIILPKKKPKSNIEPQQKIEATNMAVPNQILMKDKPLQEKENNSIKIVVYTCITGGYDALISPFKTPDVDYICFTDNMKQEANGWELRPIPEELLTLSKVKQQRLVKVSPHKYLSEYDISIWVDGSIEIKDNVKEFIKEFIYSGQSIFIPTHPQRSCIYKECDAVKQLKKDKTDLPDKQMKKYREEGYPENNGLVETNIVVRWHNNQDCIDVMETWGEEIKNFSHRDQLSFNYSLWKNHSQALKTLDKRTSHSKYFNWTTHGKHNIRRRNVAKK